MKDCKIYVLTALFICLTAVKLCFPAVSVRIEHKICRMICWQADYGEAIQAMGRALGCGQLVQVLNDLRTDTVNAMVSSLGQEQSRQTDLLPSPAPGPNQS